MEATITMAVSIRGFMVVHQLRKCPNVFVKKSRRETLPELVEPEIVVEQSDEFITKSFFRKVAHVQDSDRQAIISDPIHGDTYAMHLKSNVETLKLVGVKVERKPFVQPPPLKH